MVTLVLYHEIEVNLIILELIFVIFNSPKFKNLNKNEKSEIIFKFNYLSIILIIF